MSRTFQDIARYFEPSLTDEQCNHLLWERTCFPFGNVRQVYKHLVSAIRAARNGIHCCELCHNQIQPSRSYCGSCERALKGAADIRGHATPNTQTTAAAGRE